MIQLILIKLSHLFFKFGTETFIPQNARRMQREFKLLEKIGQGSFGKVYKATHQKTLKLVAIKVINIDKNDSELFDLRREITILSNLSHPLITKYHTSIVVGMDLWLVMDYCEGGSCRELLRSGTFGQKLIAVITKQVCQALVYLHTKANIVHRDIKAANILITSENAVKLCDFGVSAMGSKRNTFVGTPYWMAPEVIERKQSGFKADIWALGITVIELATSNPPYSDKDPLKAMQLIIRSKSPKLSDDEFGVEIRLFLAYCLKLDSDDRPTAQALLKHTYLQVNGDPKLFIQQLLSRHRKWVQNNNVQVEPIIDDENIENDEDEAWDFEFDYKRTSLNPLRYSQDLPEDLKIEDNFEIDSDDEDHQELGLKLLKEFDTVKITQQSQDFEPIGLTNDISSISNLEDKDMVLLHKVENINPDYIDHKSGWGGDQGWSGWDDLQPAQSIPLKKSFDTVSSTENPKRRSRSYSNRISLTKSDVQNSIKSESLHSLDYSVGGYIENLPKGEITSPFQSMVVEEDRRSLETLKIFKSMRTNPATQGMGRLLSSVNNLYSALERLEAALS